MIHSKTSDLDRIFSPALTLRIIPSRIIPSRRQFAYVLCQSNSGLGENSLNIINNLIPKLLSEVATSFTR
jgi:hypothetical protein